MKKEAFAAFDIGASSGRLILGVLKNGILELKEIHRFKNSPVKLGQTLYWDFLRLFEEIKNGLVKISKLDNISLISIGIDTWGVDYGWLDVSGNLINNPVCYRDDRTLEIIDEVHKIISKEDLFKQTGIQSFPFNTIYQIYYDIHKNNILNKGADKFILMPDLLGYFLTNKKTWERTITSTGSFIDVSNGQWSKDIFKSLGFPKSICGDIVDSGTILGNLTNGIQDEVGLGSIPVISIGGHDSASALVGSPLKQESLFLISGTWSLIGKESDVAFTDAESLKKGFTNESGANNKFRFLKLLTGLWIIQELKKYWNKDDKSLDFPEIIELAKGSKKDFFIDPNDARFTYSLNMEKEVIDYCNESGQGIPKSMGEIAKAVYNGITNIYKLAVHEIKEITNINFNEIVMVGGGIQDEYLCQLTADKLNLKVKAGPVEASVIGNIIKQMETMNYIKDKDERKKIVNNSFSIKEYLPRGLSNE